MRHLIWVILICGFASATLGQNAAQKPLRVGIGARWAWLTPAGPAGVTLLAVATKGCSA